MHTAHSEGLAKGRAIVYNAVEARGESRLRAPLYVQGSIFEEMHRASESAVKTEVEFDGSLAATYPLSYCKGATEIHLGDALELCSEWEPPVAIVSDGPYGVSGFDGDLPSADGLAEWYEPHIVRWSEAATPLTTLWFWNSELGWATVHPVLVRHGWTYRACCIWDKGIAHVAGNCNTRTLRKLPVVTEVCVHYTRAVRFDVNGRKLSMKEWLREEWLRSCIPLRKANDACGVKDAATRKYLTQCHLWYFPPAEAFDRLSRYANQHGDPRGHPYFSIDGINPLSGAQWESMRAKFQCELGTTNVWRSPAVRGTERLKNGSRCVHTNQKPLDIMQMLIRTSTEADDVVWEPFGGLCTGAIASYLLGRTCRSAEIDPHFYQLAITRLSRTQRLSD